MQPHRRTLRAPPTLKPMRAPTGPGSNEGPDGRSLINVADGRAASLIAQPDGIDGRQAASPVLERAASDGHAQITVRIPVGRRAVPVVAVACPKATPCNGWKARPKHDTRSPISLTSTRARDGGRYTRVAG